MGTFRYLSRIRSSSTTTFLVYPFNRRFCRLVEGMRTFVLDLSQAVIQPEVCCCDKMTNSTICISVSSSIRIECVRFWCRRFPIGMLVLQRRLDVRYADDDMAVRFSSFFIIPRWAVSCMKPCVSASFMFNRRAAILIPSPFTFTSTSTSLPWSPPILLQSSTEDLRVFVPIQVGPYFP